MNMVQQVPDEWVEKGLDVIRLDRPATQDDYDLVKDMLGVVRPEIYRRALQDAIEAIIADMRPWEGWAERNSHLLQAAERVRELDPTIPYPVSPADHG